jgi:hypothetical protein
MSATGFSGLRGNQHWKFGGGTGEISRPRHGDDTTKVLHLHGQFL